MAEWLRRLTRNQMGSSRVGSNPTRSGEFFKVTRYSKTKNFVENDHDGIRTHNLLIRSQTPYPLGHATDAWSQKQPPQGFMEKIIWWYNLIIHHAKQTENVSCDGRVVKALDLKSNGIFPRRFEPYSQRSFIQIDYFHKSTIDYLSWATTSFPYACRHCAAMAEWLRRLTRNQMGSSRVGSNPTRSVGLFEFLR